MTIKAIKEQYKTWDCKDNETNKFVTYDYNDGNGKVVIVVRYSRTYKRDVHGVIRVSDGKNLISDGDCRPCDSLDDAVDVAGEMC
jgi:hypothetical protein